MSIGGIRFDGPGCRHDPQTIPDCAEIICGVQVQAADVVAATGSKSSEIASPTPSTTSNRSPPRGGSRARAVGRRCYQLALTDRQSIVH